MLPEVVENYFQQCFSSCICIPKAMYVNSVLFWYTNQIAPLAFVCCFCFASHNHLKSYKNRSNEVKFTESVASKECINTYDEVFSATSGIIIVLIFGHKFNKMPCFITDQWLSYCEYNPNLGSLKVDFEDVRQSSRLQTTEIQCQILE